MAGVAQFLVLGGSGMLGRALCSRLSARGRRFVTLTRAEFDLCDVPRVAERLMRIEPAAVINAAAYTDVAAAERPDQAAAVDALNHAAPAELAAGCARLGIPLVHVSTDYVFDGSVRRPYREDDPVAPLQVYGRSKLAGERAVLERLPAAIVARTSTLYGPGPRPRPHYVDAILAQAVPGSKIRVVRAPVSSPTYAPDLAVALLELLDAGARGVVHVVNDGGCSRLDLARAAVRLAGCSTRVPVEERDEAPGGLDRPAYSVLDTARFRELTGRAMRRWDVALAEYVQARPR